MKKAITLTIIGGSIECPIWARQRPARSCFGCARLAASSSTKVMCMGNREPEGETPARVTVLSKTVYPSGRTTTQWEVLKVSE